MNPENNKLEIFKNNLPADSKNAIADAIHRLGIAKIEVNFDGCGDSGQIEDMTVFNEAGDEIEISLESIGVGKVAFVRGYQYNGDGTTTEIKDVRNANFGDLLEEICYNLLEQRHGGWEINEGSYGTFTFDFINQKINLTFNERVTEVNTTEIELDFGGNEIDNVN